MSSLEDLHRYDSDKPRRFLIATGTAQYQFLREDEQLPIVEEDIERMVELFTGKLGYQQVLPHLGRNPTSQSLLEGLSSWFADDARKPSDIVVLYYSGHAIMQNSIHYLLTFNSIKRNPVGTALKTEQIAEMLAQSCMQNLLVILDTCYAASGTLSLSKVAKEIVNRLTSSAGSGIYAIAATLPKQEAQEGLFSRTFVETLNELGRDNIRQEYLDPLALIRAINEHLPESQQANVNSIGAMEPPIFIPNPYYRPGQEQLDKRRQLRTLLIDQSKFLYDHQVSFVGRQKELDEIRQRITKLLPTGGYLTISGPAGQGKSCIIAKLVQESGPKKTAHHFIPFNPGSDYQVDLLRDLMAQLILKHNLSDLYTVSQRRVLLCSSFSSLLREITTKGKQEILFIDGLDQLQEDPEGGRGLSFLPTELPAGIVIVLGSRPTGVLGSLALLKRYEEYPLPNLNRPDFDLILKRYKFTLNRGLVDQFYSLMQGNALYLDLVAKELAQEEVPKSEEIIKRVADDPENIFSLSMARLRRHRVHWREILKPILGILLVAHQPLTRRQIGQILGLDDERLREGLEQLGGLIAKDGQRGYTLFHLKLYDYLQRDESLPHKGYIFATDEEKENWNGQLARWCEGDDLSLLWDRVEHNPTEQRRREYARRHYVTHLYFSRDWLHLFALLDEGAYGHAKVSYDPSTYLFARDLNLGRKAAASEEWTLEEGLEMLPRLWRYTLLQCSLGSRADQYPLALFQALLLQDRVHEAMGLAELLTKPAHKTSALIHIATHLTKHSGWNPESAQLFTRAWEIALTVEGSYERDDTLQELVAALAQVQQWELAEAVAHSIENRYQRIKTSQELVVALAQAQNWELAREVVSTIDVPWYRANALRELGSAFAREQHWGQALEAVRAIETNRYRADALRELGSVCAQMQQWKQAREMWREAREIACLMEEGDERDWVLQELVMTLAQAQQWEQAQEIAIEVIKSNKQRVIALHAIGNTSAQAQQWEQAFTMWNEAAKAAFLIEHEDMRALELRELGSEFTQAQQWEQALKLVGAIEDGWQKAEALCVLSGALARAQQWERALEVIHTIADGRQKAEALGVLGSALAQAQQWEQANTRWNEAENVVRLVEDSWQRFWALLELGSALAEAQQWERANARWSKAEEIARSIEDIHMRTMALRNLEEALVQAHQWERAQMVAQALEINEEQVKALRNLEEELVQAHQWERAQAVAQALEESDEGKALRELVSTLAKTREWERAQTAAYVITDNYQGVWAQSELWIALIQAQQWKQAHAVWAEIEVKVHTIEENWRLPQILRELVGALIQAHAWTHAQTAAHLIKGSYYRADALRELGIALTGAQQRKRAKVVWEEAEVAARSVEVDWQRAKALSTLGVALVEAHEWERAKVVLVEAKAVAGEIRDHASFERRKALQEMQKGFAQMHDWELAEATANLIEKEWRALALNKLCMSLIEAHEWQRAKIILAKAVEESHEIRMGILRARVLSKLAVASAQIDEEERTKDAWAEAEALAGSLQFAYERALALRELGASLAQMQLWEQAETVWSGAEIEARSIGESSVKAAALREMGKTFAQAKQWKRAKIIWIEAQAETHSIESTSDRAEELIKLGQGFAQIEEWELALELLSEAESVARSIELSSDWVMVLKELGAAFAQVQELEKAKAVWAEIQSEVPNIIEFDWQQRAWVLGDLGVLFAQAHELKRAEAIAETIVDGYSKAKILCEVAEVLATAGNYEHLLRMVQHAWEQAQTREDAIDLLPLVNKLIPLKPEIGLALCRVFA